MNDVFFIFTHILLAASLVGTITILARKIPLLINFPEVSFPWRFSFLERRQKRVSQEKKRQLKRDYWDKLSK